MGRSFLSNQLVEAESELVWIAKHADYLGLELGELADEIHFEGAAARSVAQARKNAREIANRCAGVDGLLAAYELVFDKGKGEG